MRTPRDKQVIEQWLRLYNRLTGSTYQVTAWPDSDSSKQNVDACCTDDAGSKLAIEHTLIEPFENEKCDSARFLRTLASLENHPELCQPGFTCIASQEVGAIPNGIRWSEVPGLIRKKLAATLPGLPEGRSTVSVDVGGYSLNIRLNKMARPGGNGQFLTARTHPGEPGPELMRRALERKLPKLAAALTDKRTLLLEDDSVAGSVESQYDAVREEPEVRKLRAGIDEIWSVRTAGLEAEHVLFTELIDPPDIDHRSFCSLNVMTGEFWKVAR